MNKKLSLLLIIFIIGYLSIGYIADFYLDFEWFKANNGYDLFWTLLLTKFNVHLIFAIIFILLFSLNFILIRLLGGKGKIFTKNLLDRFNLPYLGSPRKILLILIIIGALVFAFIMGAAASAFWKEFLMFKNALPFDGFKPDPIFNKDLGFYVFQLPFWQFLYGWLISSLLVLTIFSFFFHLFNGGIFFKNNRLNFSLFTRAHLSTLFALILILYGIGYRLSAYELLFSETGKFFGPGYTAVNANLIAYYVAMIISFIAALLLLFNIFKKSFLLPLIVLGTLFPVFFLLNNIYPGIQQRFIVEPNELNKEKPYIINNIKFTRLAYNLDKIKNINFLNEKNLTYHDIEQNKNIIKNIRLWDWRPLKQTYKQMQELKRYYTFNDVDVDRYQINNEKIAVNLSARELDFSQLEKNSQTWINQHLIYTHGYGFVLSRVDQITPEGLPKMLVYDIPPKVELSDSPRSGMSASKKLTPSGGKVESNLHIKKPEIYYGEHHNPYVITNTTIKPGEFDYPSGDQNKYTTYTGQGGIPLDSFLDRLMFAIGMKNINILLSKNITPKSRLLFRRNIMEMVSKFTPFLEFDSDPYLVLSEGKLFWILDAYTKTDRFPYSTPIKIGRKKINYIRNSVKIIIDAYNGEMNYYISDQTDPIIKVYAQIFPNLFKNLNDLSTDLKKHLRYPESIFNIQAHVLLKYHMTDPNVFYNNEDAWHLAKQVYEDNEEFVKSYYLVTKLPDENRTEFVLIIPFTPYGKNNMTAFMVAKCDPINYGELKLYSLPKDKLSYGPLQIEAKIDQEPEISKQLTLWGQKGSRVIRGNMLVVPIKDSLLFVEPLYLKAETSQMPELKKVIVSFADRVVMEQNLTLALQKIFNYKESKWPGEDFEADFSPETSKTVQEAYQYFIEAEKSLQKGDWSRYGEKLKQLKEILIYLKEKGN